MMPRFLAWMLVGLTLIAPAFAQDEPLRIDVTRGVQEPLPIAVVPFVTEDETLTRTARDVSAVVTNDLERSGLFAPIDPDAFLDPDVGVDTAPDFQDWRVIDARVLLVGRASRADDGRLQVDFRLWDVFAAEQIAGRRFSTTLENWRRVAHLISDTVYERLTGEIGYFDTRIVFVAESGPKTDRTKRLAIMDQDGANPSFLTDGSSRVLTPRFSPSIQQLVYLSYATGEPQVYLYDLASGKQEILGEFPGLSFAPRFSPDGDHVVMSLERGGNSDVFIMELARRTVRRLTRGPAIDVSPSMSPDGDEIVFSSDRSGSPQLYIIRRDGGAQRRITFGDGAYTTPVWSPRGDLIAFTRQLGDTFSIGVIRPDGLGERILTESWSDEGPTWSPNGRVIMFCRQYPSWHNRNPNGAELFSIDLTGQNLRRVPTPGDACDPAWSPLIR